MKKIITLLCFIPMLAQAQIEVGVNAGSVINATASYRLLHFLKVGIGFESVNGIQLKYEFANDNVNLQIPFAFAEYSKVIKRSEVYGGINAGIVMFTNNYDIYQYGNTGKGAALGLHAGYIFRIWKGLCANAQIGYTSVNTKIHGDASTWKSAATATNSANYVPVTVGVHYKFSFAKKGKKYL